MNKILKQVITGKDNETADFIRVICLSVVCVCEIIMLIGVIMLCIDNTFAFQELCIGVATVVTAIGSLQILASYGIKAKKETEPDQEESR